MRVRRSENEDTFDLSAVATWVVSDDVEDVIR
jgi:hypothetical protein